MTNTNYTPKRRKGKHLTEYERGKIEIMYNVNKSSYRAIAKEIGVNWQTIINEIKRGTITQVSKINEKNTI